MALLQAQPFCPLSWAWERSLAGPDGLANITRPSDELLQESIDLLKERCNNLEWLWRMNNSKVSQQLKEITSRYKFLQHGHQTRHTSNQLSS